jgi:hypothetical protein
VTGCGRTSRRTFKWSRRARPRLCHHGASARGSFESLWQKNQIMTKKINMGPDVDLPDWVKDDPLSRSTPYTEDELDRLVEGTVEGIRDTAAWKDLVRRVGDAEALRVQRARLIMMDENAAKQPRH